MRGAMRKTEKQWRRKEEEREEERREKSESAKDIRGPRNFNESESRSMGEKRFHLGVITSGRSYPGRPLGDAVWTKQQTQRRKIALGCGEAPLSFLR